MSSFLHFVKKTFRKRVASAVSPANWEMQGDSFPRSEFRLLSLPPGGRGTTQVVEGAGGSRENEDAPSIRHSLVTGIGVKKTEWISPFLRGSVSRGSDDRSGRAS